MTHNDVKFQAAYKGVLGVGCRGPECSSADPWPLAPVTCFSDSMHGIEQVFALSIDVHAEFVAFGAKTLFQFSY